MLKDGAFLKNDVFWDVLWGWHEALSDNRGDRAKLRRAKTPFEVSISPAFQRTLIRKLEEKGIRLTVDEQDRLAIGVGILAHVRTPTKGKPFARQMAEHPAASETVRDRRFMKLLEVRDPDALFLMFRRLVAWLDGSADLESLVRGTFWWNERTFRAWAVCYYAYNE